MYHLHRSRQRKTRPIHLDLSMPLISRRHQLELYRQHQSKQHRSLTRSSTSIATVRATLTVGTNINVALRRVVVSTTIVGGVDSI